MSKWSEIDYYNFEINFNTNNSFYNIKFYKFNDPKLAAHRSCGKRLRGWKFDKQGLLRKLEEIKATEIRKFYNKSVEIVHKLAV